MRIAQYADLIYDVNHHQCKSVLYMNSFSSFSSVLGKGNNARYYKRYVVTVATPNTTPVFYIDSVAQKRIEDFRPGKR